VRVYLNKIVVFQVVQVSFCSSLLFDRSSIDIAIYRLILLFFLNEKSGHMGGIPTEQGLQILSIKEICRNKIMAHGTL